MDQQDQSLNLEIVRLIEKLKYYKLHETTPVIHGTDLSAFGDQSKHLIDFIQSFSILKHPENIRQVLLWKYNTLKKKRPEIGGLVSSDIFRPLSGISIDDAELLYNCIFNQDEFLKNLKRPLEIVLLRRGKSGKGLTDILKMLPNIHTTILVSGTDDSGSWFEGAREFGATGIPGIGKALIDLAGSRQVKEFLSIRFSAGADGTVEQMEQDLYNLIERLKDPGNTAIPLHDSFQKVYFAALRINKEKRVKIIKYLEAFYKVWPESYIGKPCSFTLDDVPVRSIILLGTYYYLKAIEGDSVTWQNAIDELSRNILDLGIGNRVVVATEPRQHFIALDESGILYLSEDAITYYHDTFEVKSPFVGMWLVNQKIDSAFIGKFGNLFKVGALHSSQIPKLDHFEKNPRRLRNFIESIRNVPQESIGDLKAYLDDLSTNRNTNNLVSLSETAATALQNADVIVYSDTAMETNIAGTLVTPGFGKAIRDNDDRKLKIFLLGTDSGLAREDDMILHMENFYRYVSGIFNKTLSESDWNKLYQHVSYIINTIGESLNKRILKMTYNTVLTQTINAAKDEQYGFFFETALSEVILSLAGISKAGFLSDSEYGIMNKRNVEVSDIAGCHLQHSGYGLFKDEEISHFIKQLRRQFFGLAIKGGIGLDVDMTMLPKKAEFLTDYPELAYQFTQLLRNKIWVAIISGNSAEEQIPRIKGAIAEEMKGDTSGFEYLKMYVDGGATKISFDQKGNEIKEESYKINNSLPFNEIRLLVNIALKEFFSKTFGSCDLHLDMMGSEVRKRYPELNLTPAWEVKDWEPEWLTPLDLQERKKKKGKINFPWVEIRGKDEKTKTVSSIAIKPTPVIETETKRADIRDDLQRIIIKHIKSSKELTRKFSIRSGGLSTTDITQEGSDKTAAMKDFITTCSLDHKKVYYFGDEFFKIPRIGRPQARAIDAIIFPQNKDDIQVGNDEVIAMDSELGSIHTLAVNSDQPINQEKKTLWIGRSPQAVMEFLEKIIPS